MTHENKFGMFIHWGIYALTELHEQALARYGMKNAEYEALAKRFDPVNYDPEGWVLLAKEAGMKYICFTAKHHDGFCMWDTKYTDYNIMNTPYGKDVLKMLADACRKHGMLLSLYYSNPDWHCEYACNPASTHQWKAPYPERSDTVRYREFIKNQITELLTGYGDIYTLFWDIPPKIEDRSLNELVRKLQPGIFINDRGWDKGDFSTPEREYQSTEGSRFERMTEACNSVGQQSWGYRRDEDFYSLRHLTCSIDRIMAMGGSYLLNVGPNAQGEITPEYADRIRLVGEWYKRTEGCLESAEAAKDCYEAMHAPCIATEKDGKVYLHLYNGLISSALTLKSYPALPKRVRLMNTGEELRFAEMPLPEFVNGNTGVAEKVFLHISGIPIDSLSNQPLILELTY